MGEIPETFNMATYVCDRWTNEKDRVAIFADDDKGSQETYTYRRLRNAANAVANGLRGRGVERGDRVAINLRQRPETIVPTSPAGNSARSRSR